MKLKDIDSISQNWFIKPQLTKITLGFTHSNAIFVGPQVGKKLDSVSDFIFSNFTNTFEVFSVHFNEIFLPIRDAMFAWVLVNAFQYCEFSAPKITVSKRNSILLSRVLACELTKDQVVLNVPDEKGTFEEPLRLPLQRTTHLRL